MRLVRGLSLSACALLWLACRSDLPPGPAGPASVSLANGSHAVEGRATGGGHYDIEGLIVQFSMSALQKSDGRAAGGFHHRLEIDGERVEFHGAVTCLAVDSENHRAWIGGIVTKNKSTHPDFTTAIHEPGKDIWFRVVDYGQNGAAQPDRTTFTGFEGAAGIITSEEYCEARIWPAEDARTWPVAGNIQVRP